MKRFLLTLTLVLVVPVVASAAQPRGYSGYSGRSSRCRQGGLYGGPQLYRSPDWYQFYAGQAALRSQRLYGPVPGAGGFSGSAAPDIQFSNPQYIINPFCKENATHAENND